MSKHNSRYSAVASVAMLLFANGVWSQDSSRDYTEAYQQRALEIYRTSIAFRTAVPHEQVPAMASYLADQFRAGGFTDDDIRILPFVQDDGEETAALIVRYRGDGSSDKEPILLVAHMDVVDALPEDWERDPFTLIEEDGYFFGRGTLDNKFGTTMLTSTFLRLREEGFVPDRDLIIAFTGDEETTVKSTRGIVTTYRDLTDAEFALNSDAGGGVLDSEHSPVTYLMQTAEKTYATFELTVRNPGGHSSQPRADNAIYELASAIENIESYRFPVRWNAATLRYFELAGATRTGELGEAMRSFSSDPGNSEAANVLWRYPAEVGYTRTTCIPTMLSAGHAENALPQSATVTVNCRIFPGVEIDEVAQTLVRLAENPEIEIAVLGDPLASTASPLRDDVVDAVTTVLPVLVDAPVPLVPFMSAYYTDGGEIRAAGIPTYGVSGVFIRDEDAFAHGLNERVPVRSFFAALEYWPALIKELSTH